MTYEKLIELAELNPSVTSVSLKSDVFDELLESNEGTRNFVIRKINDFTLYGPNGAIKVIRDSGSND